jgi:hypothetical protein
MASVGRPSLFVPIKTTFESKSQTTVSFFRNLSSASSKYSVPTVCPGCPVPAVLSEWSCHRFPLVTATVVLSRLCCLSYPVVAVMFWLFCLCCLSWQYYLSCLLWLPVPVLLSLLSSYSSFHVLLSCPSFLVLSPLSCPSSSAQAQLSTALLTLLSFPGSPLWLSCPSCSLLAVLSWLSCPGYRVPAVLSQLSCANCLPQQSYPRLSWRCCPGIAVISCIVLSVMSGFTFPGCPVRMPFLDWPTPAVLSQ